MKQSMEDEIAELRFVNAVLIGTVFLLGAVVLAVLVVTLTQ